MTRNKLVMMVVALAAVIAMAVPVLVSGASVRAPKGYGGGNEPTFDPANFGAPVANSYFPLEPGTRSILRGVKDGLTQTERSTVTDRTKQILGVTATVIRDVSLHHGRPLEATFDWYAADNDGNVWYFGEDTKELDDNGHVISTQGSWEAGVDGAVPGRSSCRRPQAERRLPAGVLRGARPRTRPGSCVWAEGSQFPDGTVHDVIRSLDVDAPRAKRRHPEGVRARPRHRLRTHALRRQGDRGIGERHHRLRYRPDPAAAYDDQPEVRVRVLVVEDTTRMGELIRRGLQEQGYAVDLAQTGEDGLWLASENPYDVVILDVGLPDLDGFEVCRRLRGSDRWMPVLMLTARDAVGDRVTGLDAGADDYLVKPFDFVELLARVRALVRRGATERPTALRLGDLSLDPSTHRVARGDVTLDLTAKEFALLELFMRRPGDVLSRMWLLEHAWDFAYEGGSNIVDVYIRYLREKIDRPFQRHSLETVRGAGYRLRDDLDAADAG